MLKPFTRAEQVQKGESAEVHKASLSAAGSKPLVVSTACCWFTAPSACSAMIDAHYLRPSMALLKANQHQEIRHSECKRFFEAPCLDVRGGVLGARLGGRTDGD